MKRNQDRNHFTVPNHLPDSTSRPAWTQEDLTSFQHLHRRGIRQGHFIGTRGFSTMKDLKFFETNRGL